MEQHEEWRTVMWVNESVIYQIYPLGFCGAPHSNGDVQEKDRASTARIQKVGEWADYLAKLGVDTLLLNPLFESDRHGYDTRDYRKVDCRLGTNADFAAVCQTLHQKKLRILLDGVFNHVGRGFWAFQDVLKNRENSPYKDWFFIRFSEDNGYHDGLFYEGWEGHYELVKLNLRNPAVVQHLFDSIRGWVEEFDIDGLRLDVAYCLDKDFMRQLRSFCNGLKPEFALIGEMLFGDYKQIVSDELLHSCTNYECYKGLYSSFNDKNLFEISHSLKRQFGGEAWALYRGLHLVSFADNHDVSRIASILKEKRNLSQVYGMLFGMPGIPCIYYGSEWGTEGDKQNGDDGLRPSFDTPVQNELSAFVARLIAIRRENKALCYGDYRDVAVSNRQLVFERSFEGERILVAVNLDETAAVLRFNAGAASGVDLLSGGMVSFTGEQPLPPFSVAFWKIS